MFFDFDYPKSNIADIVRAMNEGQNTYETIRWSNPEWQLCPKCKGDGFVFNKHASTTSPTEKCPVCKSKMIINTKTGKPPK